ncbi:MAG TPA: zinc ABC transporter substrate-binding protein [Actinomycetaceae bacterium]|nr:zinc ABC transporter substrate-binding protein [Actinomycetaceae bacterium]
MRTIRTRLEGLWKVTALTGAALVLAACGGGGGATATDAPTATPTTETATAGDDATSAEGTDITVVASTSWVGAFAELAGATDVTVLAPADLQHPPDYDPRPSDLQALDDADLVVLGGFESFAEQMQEAVGSDAATVQVEALNTLPVINEQVMKIAAELGTEEIATQNLADFEDQVLEIQAELRAALAGGPATVASHTFMQPWPNFAGFEIVGTYGPAPMSPSELQEFVGLSPDAVIDNAHVPGGAALAEELGIPTVATRNFPGPGESLIDVFQYNADLMIDTFGGES